MSEPAFSTGLNRLDAGDVTDFGDAHIGAYRCLAFNLADAAGMCGIAALLLEPAFPAAFKVGTRPMTATGTNAGTRVDEMMAAKGPLETEIARGAARPRRRRD